MMDSHIKSNIEENRNCELRSKSDQRSTQLRLKGNEKVSQHLWWEAIELYNQSICAAKIDSENISLAYANRSLCFMTMHMYDKCIADIELATNANYPKQSMSKLAQRRKFCMEHRENFPQRKVDILKPDFAEDENFPGMANILKFQYDDHFGWHLVAEDNIAVGEIVLVEDAFVASPVVSPAVDVCSNCFKARMNFIPCKNCSESMFCSQACAENDKFHEISCGNSVLNTDHLLPYAVRSVLLALSIFSDIGDLIKFVKNVLNEKENEELLSTAMQSKYRAFLKLNFRLEDEERYTMDNRPYELYVQLMSQPGVKEKVRSKTDERFLMFLSVIHMNILYCNSFQNNVAGFLFLILNRINQSTPTNPPNLLRWVFTDKMILTASRPIKRGEQLFILYDDRCCVLQTRFKCNVHTQLYGESHIYPHGCDPFQTARNNFPHQPPSSKEVELDPDYQCILERMRHMDILNSYDSTCTGLKEICLGLLEKYQDMPWNFELRKVSYFYEQLSNGKKLF